MSTFFGHVCHHSLVSDSESSNYFPMHFIGLSTSDEISSSLPFILKRLLICLVPTTKNLDYFALNFMHANVTIPSGKEKTHLVCTSLVVVTARSSMKPFIGLLLWSSCFSFYCCRHQAYSHHKYLWICVACRNPLFQLLPSCRKLPKRISYFNSIIVVLNVYPISIP